MKIIVTGGAGFIGSHIVEELLAGGHDVAIADNFSTGSWSNIRNKHCFQADIREKDFQDLVRGLKPQAICHQAAQASLLRSVEEPVFDADVNIIGTLRVIEAARAVGAKVVMASTSAVYDDTDRPMTQECYAEHDPIGPTRPYGIAKAAAEMYLRNAAIPYTILRYGNVYGPRQVPVGENQLVPHALDHLILGKPFIVNGDGNNGRDFIYATDVAQANRMALESDYSGTLNIGTGLCNTVNVVLRLLCEITGDTDGVWQHGPAKPNEPHRVSLMSEKAANKIGWRSKVGLKEGLTRTVAWYRSEHAGESHA